MLYGQEQLPTVTGDGFFGDVLLDLRVGLPRLGALAPGDAESKHQDCIATTRSTSVAGAVPSPQKIVPSPRKFTEDPLCDVRNPRNGAAIFAVPRLNLLCSQQFGPVVPNRTIRNRVVLHDYHFSRLSALQTPLLDLNRHGM